MIEYLARDIPTFIMYCVNGESRSSLLIESTYPVTFLLLLLLLLLPLLLIYYYYYYIPRVDDFEGAVEEVRARYLALLPEAQMQRCWQTMRR